MARKKEYITTLYKRDDDTLKALGRTGYYDADMIKENFNQSDRRITNMCRDGYLVKEDTMRGTFYKLGDKGKDYVEKEFGIKCYPAQSPNHDMELSRKYCSLSEDARETWRTELEVRQDVYNYMNDLRDKGDFAKANEIEQGLKDGTMSMPDCKYIYGQGREIQGTNFFRRTAGDFFFRIRKVFTYIDLNLTKTMLTQLCAQLLRRIISAG